jgi:single-stranded-DNA-specific exonuclease
MVDNLSSLCTEAATLVRSFSPSTRMRIISHYDADGCTAACIVTQALRREGYDVHTTLMRNPFTQGLQRVKEENNELVLFTDMGSGQLSLIKEFPGKAIIIDHHQAPSQDTGERVLQINANLCGINGNYEACGASLSYAFAMALNKENKDLSALALVGITGDKQYIGGIRGYNQTVVQEALDHEVVTKSMGMKLSGSTLHEALYTSIDPYFSGLSGNKDAVQDLLKNLQLPEDSTIESLSEDQIRELHSTLMLLLLQKGCEENILDTVIRERYALAAFQMESERFADLIDACSKGGHRGLALRLCLGDTAAYEEALKVQSEYKHIILQELLRLEHEGSSAMKNFRYFYSTDSSLGGVIGGIAVNFLFDREKPLLSLVRKNNELHVSCRGNQYLVARGLDLGRAMRESAEQLGGHGGGHQIASGATIAIEKEKEFLRLVDQLLSIQLEGDSQ